MAGGGHIRGFDGLRGISIILVLAQHLGVHQWLPEGFARTVYHALFTGEAGVNVFFALSGLLITRLLLREQRATGTLDLRKFYIRRFLRLLPPMVVFIAITAALGAAGRIHLWWPGLLVSFLYLYNFIPKTVFQGALSHTWSLAVEEQFYLFWPFVLRALRRRTTVLVAVSIVLVSAVAYLWFPVMTIPGSASGLRLDNVFHVRRLFIPAVSGIMIGSLAAVLLHERPAHVARWCVRWWWPATTLLLYVLPLGWPGILAPLGVMPQAIAVSMLLLWLMHHQSAPLAAALELKPLAYVGRISYGLYIYHVIFMGTGPGQGQIPWFPLNVLASVAFAALSYEVMERRLLKLKERFR